MSAAVTRANRVEHDTDEFTQLSDPSISVKLEARPVIEDHGMTPLMRAACDGSAGTVQALLDRGAEVNAKRTDGFNALALAAFFGHAQVVWLLLENGADLAATTRSETLPEMWADIRGFVDVGDTIREARPAKQVEAPNPRTTAIPEPARFPRPAENEKFQPAGVTGSGVEVSVIAEALDLETPLVMIPAPVVQESESSVIDAASETTPAIIPEPRDEESQPSIIDAASDPEATLVRPRASVNEESPASGIDTASDPETTLVTTDAPFSHEGTPTRVEPLADIVPPDKPEQAPEQAKEQPIIKPPIRVLKTLPEIEDPLPLVVPEFRPGSVFVARITSSRRNLVALVIAVWLASTCIAYFLIPQIRKSFANGRTETVTKTTNLPTESSNPIAGSATGVSGSVETPSAATTESTNAPASSEIEKNAADNTTNTSANTENIESTSRVDSAEATESSAGNAAQRGSESSVHSISSTFAGNSVPAARVNRRALIEATSMSRSAEPARKQRAVSRAAKSREQTAADEPPKPAPLSVEVSRSRSVLSTPARSASEVPGSQPPPLSITSDKPKSKVIQWP